MSKKKLVPLVGQTGLDSYLDTTPKGRKNYSHSALGTKKRTPLSPEHRTQKKSSIHQVNPIDEEDNMEDPENQEEKDPSHEGGSTGKEVYKHFSIEMIECLKEVMREIQRPLEEKLNTLLDIQSRQSEQDETLQKLTQEQKILRENYEKTERENQTLKSRVYTLESKLLESNLIMHGVPEDTWEIEENQREKVVTAITNSVDGENPWDKLKVAHEIPIRNTKQIGTFKQGRKRPISICFEQKSHVDTLLQSKKHLPQGIYVDREYSPEIEARRKTLRPILKLARNIDKYKKKSKLEEDYLVILGKKYTVHNLYTLPPDLSGYTASSKTDPNTVAFFGELNPFSNFHPALFHSGGKCYPTSEHYIQECKTLFFRDETSAKQMLLAKTALEAKQAARNIANYDHEKWMSAAKLETKPGLLMKFKSHTHLNKMLQETGTRQIVESSFDKTWGTGVPIHDKHCLNSEKWHGIGLLGEILMEVCDELAQPGNNIATMDTTT